VVDSNWLRVIVPVPEPSAYAGIWFHGDYAFHWCHA
jgi:hypothetical protein